MDNLAGILAINRFIDLPFGYPNQFAEQEIMAERVGFEPTVEFPQHTLSKRAP